MLILTIKVLGWWLARLPECALRVVCAALGDLLFWTFKERRHIILSNLHHAFPEKPEAWRRGIARESCRRMIELGMFLLISPWLNEKRLRKMISVTPETLAEMKRFTALPVAKVVMIPHFTLMESLFATSLFLPEAAGNGVMFRPVQNAALNRWVKRTREKFGFKLLSRREGFKEAFAILRRKGFVCALFDQSARHQGIPMTFFGRVVSATHLPDLMAKKFAAEAGIFFTRRTGFMRARYEIIPLRRDESFPYWVTQQANLWLENYLRENDDQCADWLWLHARWKCQHRPAQRLRLVSKKNTLADDLRFHGWSEPPRQTRFWLWLPDSLEAARQVLPFLPRLRASRPDAEITLIMREKLKSNESELSPLADALIFVPENQGTAFFKKLAGRYPDVCLLPNQSAKEDREAFLTGCPERYGIKRAGESRPHLTHYCALADAPLNFAETLEKYFQHFGLPGWRDR